MAFKIGSSTVVDNQTQFTSKDGAGAIIRVFPAKGAITSLDPLILNNTGTVSKYPQANNINFNGSYYTQSEIINQNLFAGDFVQSSIDNNGRIYLAYRTGGNAPGIVSLYNSANAIVVSSAQTANLLSDGTGARWIYSAACSPYTNEFLVITGNTSYRPVRTASYNYQTASFTFNSNTFSYHNGVTTPFGTSSIQVVFNDNYLRNKLLNPATDSSGSTAHLTTNDALNLTSGQTGAWIFQSDSTGAGVGSSYTFNASTDSLNQNSQRWVGDSAGLGTGSSRLLIGAYQSSNNKVVSLWKIGDSSYRYVNHLANNVALDDSSISSNGTYMTSSGVSDVYVPGGRGGPFYDAATDKAAFVLWDSASSSARIYQIPHTGGSASAGGGTYANLATAISHTVSYGESPYYGNMSMALTRDHNGYFHVAYVPRNVDASGAQLGVYVAIFSLNFSTMAVTNLVTGTRLLSGATYWVQNIHVDPKTGKGTIIYNNTQANILAAVSYTYNKPTTRFLGLAANSATDGANVEVVMPGSFYSYSGAAAGVDYYIRAGDGKLSTANVGPKVAAGIANSIIFVLPRTEL